MKRTLVPLLLLLAVTVPAFSQATEQSLRPEKRSWVNRLLHPFHTEKLPEYKDANLRGLTAELQLSPQPIKLSEVRQMDVRVTLSNRSKRPITLDFPTEQRFEINLRTSGGKILTIWSDNHAFAEEPGVVLINPGEHIEYAETIATRELTPNKVFIAEVVFEKYPELHIRQKFLTAP
jgi:hypothetical protein